MDCEQHEYLSRLFLILFLVCLVGAATGEARGLDEQTVKLAWYMCFGFSVGYAGLGLVKKGR